MATANLAPPATTTAFINTLGVNTHVSTGANGYGNIANVIADMKYLGITNARDGDNGSFASLMTMANAGIKFDFIFAGGGPFTASTIQGELNVVHALPAGSVYAVEGPNEINNFPITYNGVGGLQGAVDFQTALYSMAHADSALPGVKVFYFTGYDAGGLGIGPNPATTPGLADYNNQHPYPSWGSPPAATVAPGNAFPNETSPTGPGVYTEAGYSYNGGFGSTLTQAGVARYMLDMFMDDAANGINRTYIYELMEEGDGLGLFDKNNNPTAAATAIHNLTSILADSGTVPALAAAPNFSVSNLPSSGRDMALLKSTGASDIVVWAEPQITASGASLATPVTVSLGATYGTVRVFDPLVGTTAIQTLSNVTSINLSLTDHPLIVETGPGIVPTPTPTPTPTPSPTPTPVPSPNNTVVVAGSTAAITDAAGNKWTITSGAEVAVNGIVDTVTHAVTELAYVNGKIWQENFANLWWGKTSQSGIWMPTAGTSTSPLPTTPPASDTLTLAISEDAYKGDAQFTVGMDGKQIGGTYTASALHSSGDSNVFVLTGNWGQGGHNVQITFLNDAWDGVSSTNDRNLHIDSIGYDGKTYANTAFNQNSGGTATFAVGASNPINTAAAADLITLHLSEDAWQGNAQFTLSIDGKQVSTPQAVVALHSSGQWEDLAFVGKLGAATHTIGVTFTNDKWGGTPTTDRNLYVNGIDVNGKHYGSSSTTLFGNGTASFSVTTTS